MKVELYSYYDIKSCMFEPPFGCINVDHAKRVFGDRANDSSRPVGRHPEDYRMFCVGIMFDETGVISSYDKGPKFICDAVNLLNPTEGGD